MELLLVPGQVRDFSVSSGLHSALFLFYPDYPEPLSDAFLVLVSSDIQADSELCTRLDIRETLFAEISNHPEVYLNESLITMKVNES